MKKVFKYILLLSVVAFASCKTDLDLLAPYQETTVVYGLLNAGDSTQYLRINKAFLGPQDAYQMAQHPDSFNYPDILDVTLERWKFNSMMSSVTLLRDSSIALEPGIFASSPNILYKTPLNYMLDNESTYKLNVHNRQTGKIIRSSTDIVGDISLSGPLNFGAIVNFVGPNPYSVEWYTATNGKVYNVAFHFEYQEVDDISGLAVDKSIDWDIATLVAENVDDLKKYVLAIDGSDFYSFVKTNVPVVAHKTRHIKLLQFVFTTGSDEFYTYYVVNAPPTTIVQNIPDYTNIDGGRGVFASRSILRKTCTLDDPSRDTLFHGSVTGVLNFQ